jgi:hypothetical protein
MSAKTYTQEQILSGLRMIWRETYNFDAPIYPDESFIEAFNAKSILFKADIDLYDVLYRLEAIFGFKCPMKEWLAFLGEHIQDPSEWEKTVAPKLTFRALADFVGERLKEPVSLEPITLLGKPCLTAGIFRALEQLAEEINPKVTRFAPSTPIRVRLSGFSLYCFWSRLRWIMEDQLPPPPQIPFPDWRFLNRLFVKLGVGLLIALWKRDLAGLLEGIGVTLLLFLPVGMILAYINAALLNPLPDGIETFGDLARVLAAIILDQQTEAASCSTP